MRILLSLRAGLDGLEHFHDFVRDDKVTIGYDTAAIFGMFHVELMDDIKGRTLMEGGYLEEFPKLAVDNDESRWWEYWSCWTTRLGLCLPRS